jgi:hypothetical protein
VAALVASDIAKATAVPLLAAVAALVHRDVRRLSSSVLAAATAVRLLAAMAALVTSDHRCTVNGAVGVMDGVADGDAVTKMAGFIDAVGLSEVVSIGSLCLSVRV